MVAINKLNEWQLHSRNEGTNMSHRHQILVVFACAFFGAACMFNTSSQIGVAEQELRRLLANHHVQQPTKLHPPMVHAEMKTTTNDEAHSSLIKIQNSLGCSNVNECMLKIQQLKEKTTEYLQLPPLEEEKPQQQKLQEEAPKVKKENPTILNNLVTEEEEASPAKVEINERNTISILTYSNGQSWCDENAFWNAYYQIPPPGIQKIELLFYETSNQPSRTWLAWAEKYKFSTADTHFSIQYRWYNASEPKGSKLNPKLGKKRNDATKASKGYLLVNFDNDDVYHPNYISYVVYHLDLNPSWLNLAVACHASAQFNPDGTYSISYCDPTNFDPSTEHEKAYKKMAHRYSTYKTVFTDYDCWWRRSADISEEHNLVGCMYMRKLPIGKVTSVNSTIPATTATGIGAGAGGSNNGLGNTLLLIKTKSPLSITNQMYHTGRELFNRLTIDDTRNLLAGMRKFYQDMHELQRPASVVTTIPVTVTDPIDNEKENLDGNSTFALSLPPIPVRSWKNFQEQHPTFFSTQNYAHCDGFASMVGMTYLPTPDKTMFYNKVHNAKACCKICSAMNNVTAANVSTSWPFPSDDINHNYCGGFTFDVKAKRCLLGLGNISLAPWTAVTHETGIRIDPTCPDCGSQLDGISLG